MNEVRWIRANTPLCFYSQDLPAIDSSFRIITNLSRNQIGGTFFEGLRSMC